MGCVLVVPQVSVRAERVLFGDGDVATVARALLDQGARALQLRDVDGSIAEQNLLPMWLTALVHDAGVPVQFDGSLVSGQAIERVARERFESVVIGMGAVLDPLVLRWAHDLLGSQRMVVEILADGEYLYDPPDQHRDLTVLDAARTLRFQGVSRMLLRDVTGMELPLRMLRSLCDDEQMHVTFQGLVRNVGDIAELADVSHGMEAVIVGEPLYDGRISIDEANRTADTASR